MKICTKTKRNLYMWSQNSWCLNLAKSIENSDVESPIRDSKRGDLKNKFKAFQSYYDGRPLGHGVVDHHPHWSPLTYNQPIF